jgi:hypothetical protein
MLSKDQLKSIHIAAGQCGLTGRAAEHSCAEHRELVQAGPGRCPVCDAKMIDAYHVMLRAEFGVESSKVLDNRGFERLMHRLAELGSTVCRANGTPFDGPQEPGKAGNQQLFKVRELLRELGLDEASDYARGVFRKARAADRVAWFTRDQAGKVIDALNYMIRNGREMPAAAGGGGAMSDVNKPAAAAPARTGEAPRTGEPSGTTDAEKVWAFLAPHRGEKNARKARQIAEATRIGDAAGTAVRALISDAAEFFPAPVGAHPNIGFFVIETADEGQRVRADLRSRLEADARRISILDRKMESCLGFKWDGLSRTYVKRESLF